MGEVGVGEVTLLIGRAREGDRGAFDRIFELLYPELRRIAHRRLVRGARATGTSRPPRSSTSAT